MESRITGEKNIIIELDNKKNMSLNLKMENNLDYSQEDIDYIKEIYNTTQSLKGGIFKGDGYIYWELKSL